MRIDFLSNVTFALETEPPYLTSAGVTIQSLKMAADKPGPSYWDGAAPPSSVLGVGAKVPSSLFGVGSLAALGKLIDGERNNFHQ